MLGAMISLRIVLLLFPYILAENIRYEIINSIGSSLHIKTWGFNRSRTQEIFEVARYLALQRKYIVFLDDLINDSTEQSICVADNFSYIWDKMKSNVSNTPKSWVVFNSPNESFLEDAQNFNGLLFFLDKNPRRLVLTSIFKFCLGCLINVNSQLITTSKDLQHFESFVVDSYPGLNGSTIVISLDTLNNCDQQTNFDPFFTIQCYHIDIIEMMAKSANFSSLFVVPPYPGNLYDFPNGGMFIQIFTKVVDLSAASFVTTDERLEVMDLVWPTYEIKAVMFMKEKPFGIVWMAYLFPLSMEIWLSLLSSVVTATIVLYILMRKGLINKSTALKDPFLHSFQIICYQGVDYIPKKLSCRIAYISLLMTAIVILPSYSGYLISYLTIRPTNSKFTYLQQLLEDGQYKITTRRNHFIDQRLRSTLAVTHPEAFVRLEDRAENEIDGFNQICQDKLSYAIEEDIYRPFIDTYDCEIKKLPFTVMFEYFGMGLPKKSLLTEYLLRGNLLAKSSGLTNRMRLYFQQNQSKKLIRGFEGVTLSQIAPILIFLLMVKIFSLSILLCEKFIFTREARNN